MSPERLLIVGLVLALVGALVVLRRCRAGRVADGPTRVDPAGLGLDERHGDTAVVAFSGPLCHACQEWGDHLSRSGIPYRKVDVLREAGLARAHGVTTTPVILVIDRRSGDVLERFVDGPADEQVERVRELALV